MSLKFSVLDTSVLISGARGIKSAAAYAALTAFAQGDYILVEKRVYFAAIAGTTADTTAPTHADGDVVDGTVTWRRVPRGDRQTFQVVNDSADLIYLSSDGQPAVLNEGNRLNANGGAWNMPNLHNGEIFAIAVTTASNLTIDER